MGPRPVLARGVDVIGNSRVGPWHPLEAIPKHTLSTCRGGAARCPTSKMLISPRKMEGSSLFYDVS